MSEGDTGHDESETELYARPPWESDERGGCAATTWILGTCLLVRFRVATCEGAAGVLCLPAPDGCKEVRTSPRYGRSPTAFFSPLAARLGVEPAQRA